MEYENFITKQKEKYGDEAVVLMAEILGFAESSPIVPLRYFTKVHKEDIGFLISLFITLERENLIRIIKP